MEQRDKLSFLDQKNKIFPVVLVISLTAFYCTLPLFVHKGLPIAHDMVFHIFHADQFNRAINEGIFYPRWVPDSNNGYGTAYFVFYAPLSYYFVSLINFLIPSFTLSMIIAIWFSFFLSGLTMFIAVKRMFGSPSSFLAGVIYQMVPFHILDLYIRGTFAELFAFTWFPLIILFMYESLHFRHNKYAYLGLYISYAGLILTHLVSGFIFTLVIGAYFIYNFFLLKDKRPLIKTLFSLALGLGLSSVYLIPVIFERKFVQIQHIVNCPVGNYKKNFLFTFDKFQSVLRDFYTPLHVIVILEVMLFLVVVLLMHSNREGFANRPKLNFFITLFLSAFFLTTPLSRPLWDSMPGFPTIQFPWRWVPAMELSLCFLIGSIFSGRTFTIAANLKKRVIIYLLILLSLASFVTILNSKIIPEKIIDEILKSEQYNAIEYTPIWAKDIEGIMNEAKREKVSVISGEAQYAINEWRSEKRKIRIKASAPALLRISTFYYPGWEARIDDRNIPIIIENKSGAMLIEIPKGEYTLELRFVNTSLRRFSRIISLASLVIVAFLAIIQKRF